MSLPDFETLWARGDRRRRPVGVAVAGGADPTVLQALRVAADRGWVRPILAGDGSDIRGVAGACGIDLGGFEILDSSELAEAAVAACREGQAELLMKGRIATPALMHAVLDPERGLRTDRAVCQVVLMEIPRDDRRFLMADTGILVRPKLARRGDVLRHAVELARTLGLEEPRVALMAATESASAAMPDTVDAAELARRAEAGEFGRCRAQGPLSFDLAYADEAGARKRVDGPVVGAADAMIFPDLASANLTVKAIMYTADCRFGGVLRGTTHPVVFMSRADSAETRLRSLALSLALVPDDAGASRQVAGPPPG